MKKDEPYAGPVWYTACMVIHSAADIPLRATSLVEALRDFARFVQQHLSVEPGSEVSIAIAETGARANDTLARSLPDDVKEFSLGRLTVGPSLTAAQFRNVVASAKPKKTRSQVRLNATTIPDVFALLERLAAALPPSGRGIMLLVHLSGWRMAAPATAVPKTSHPEVAPAPSSGTPAVEATLSRFRHGAHDISATAGLRFHALSLKDPIVAATIAAASTQTGLRFGKPMAAFAAGADQKAIPQTPQAADPRLQPPSQEAQLVVLLSLQEAMARAADQIGARTEDLAGIPLLFSRSGGFHKRMRDVMARKRESVNLPSRLKLFMKERFPDYRFDAADPEQLWFRKPMAPTLDLLLMFDKVHQWGLGKTFSIDVAVDFPNTPFGGMHTGWGGTTRKNIFWMFHEGWEKQVWAYTSNAELATALDGCGALLGRILPAVEEQCRRLLLPVPATLPQGIDERGPLSAREAYTLVLPMARAWAGDAQLEIVGSSSLITVRDSTGPSSSISEDGRLRRQGSWGLKFLSKLLDRYCYYTVPYAGRVWWNFYPVLQGAIPKYSSVIEADDWIDSTSVAPRAFQAIEQHSGNLRSSEISLALRDPQRYSGKYVWEAFCIAYGASLSERRDITVQLDARTGAVLGSVAR